MQITMIVHCTCTHQTMDDVFLLPVKLSDTVNDLLKKNTQSVTHIIHYLIFR